MTRRIAIFLPNWIGDVCMATPTIRAFHKRYHGEARLVGIMRSYVARVLDGTSWLDESWIYEKKQRTGPHSPLALIRRMRAEPPDLAVLLTNSVRSAGLAWLGGARRRVGYAASFRSWMLSDSLPRVPRVPHVLEYLSLARLAGCGGESPRLELRTRDVDDVSAAGVWSRLNLQPDRVVAFNCASGGFKTKLWPQERFGALARRIAAELEHDVLVLCGPGEQALAERVRAAAAHPRVFTMAEQPLDLGTSKAVIRRCRMMVSTDSGPSHIAIAFGCPVVTLYGPVTPDVCSNPVAVSYPISLELDCLGCRRAVCPLKHHRCMLDLTVDRVFAQVVRCLRENAPRHGAAA